MYRREPTAHVPQPTPPRGSVTGSRPHPTSRHLAADLADDDGELWQLLDVLTRPDGPQLLHDVLRRLAALFEADEVALYAGHLPAVLIATYGRHTFADRQQITDPRLSQALTERTPVTLTPDQRDSAWRIDPHTVIRTGLWVPSPADATTPAVVRVLRIRPEPFPAGSQRLLGIVARRLAAALDRMQQQRFDQTRDTERSQLFLVAASVAQGLDFELIAERVVLGVTSVTDFADATIEIRRDDTVHRAAAFGNGELTDHMASPLGRWQSALDEERRVGQMSYRVTLRDALPVPAGDQQAETTSGLVIPLEDDDSTPLGFLTLSHPRTGAEPTEQMLQTIELFARQAQIALMLERAQTRGREQASRHAQLVELLTAVASTSDVEALFERIVGAVRARMDGHAVAMMRPTRNELHVLATVTDDRLRCPLPPLRVPLSPQLHDALQAVFDRGTLRFDDVREQPGLSLIARPETRSVLLGATRGDNAVLVTVSTTQAAAFDAAHERFLSELMPLIALAARAADRRAAPQRPPPRPSSPRPPHNSARPR